jgi:hypothetical protein
VVGTDTSFLFYVAAGMKVCLHLTQSFVSHDVICEIEAFPYVSNNTILSCMTKNSCFVLIPLSGFTPCQCYEFEHIFAEIWAIFTLQWTRAGICSVVERSMKFGKIIHLYNCTIITCWLVNLLNFIVKFTAGGKIVNVNCNL